MGKMMYFEIAVVNTNHEIEWTAHSWRENVTIASLKQEGLCRGDNFGVFGSVVEADYVVRPGDRIECYQPLHEDPKAARRSRLQ